MSLIVDAQVHKTTNSSSRLSFQRKVEMFGIQKLFEFWTFLAHVQAKTISWQQTLDFIFYLIDFFIFLCINFPSFFFFFF